MGCVVCALVALLLLGVDDGRGNGRRGTIKTATTGPNKRGWGFSGECGSAYLRALRIDSATTVYS